MHNSHKTFTKPFTKFTNLILVPCLVLWEIHNKHYTFSPYPFPWIGGLYQKSLPLNRLALCTPPIAEILCVKNGRAIVVCGFLMK